MEEREEEEVAGATLGDTGTSDRGRFAQGLEVDRGGLQRAAGLLEVSPKALAREEAECLLDGKLRLASSKVGATPWSHLLSLYKQLQKSAMAKVRVGVSLGLGTPSSPAQPLENPQFPLKESLPLEDKDIEEEMEEEHSSLKLYVPGIVTLPSPLHKTFRSTDTVGFMESELKKLLVVQRESCLWKMDSPEGRGLLTQPEVTLEEVGIVDSQHLFLEEMEEMGNWLPG